MNANDITRLLLAFQPHRGLIVHDERIEGVITKDQLRLLVKGGWLTRHKDGLKRYRFHFTTAAYTHLGRIVP